MAFRLVYDPRWLVVDLLKASLAGLGLLSVAAFFYLVPGYALLAYLWQGESFPWPARMGVAAGLSLALYPLLFLWTDLVGLHLGPLYAWIPAIGGLAALAWRYRRWRPRQGWDGLHRWVRSDTFWPDLAFMVVLALVFAVRLLVVRGLAAPMWGDSYQHTLIAQLLIDNRGLFGSWEPYVPYRSLTTHFGFPATVAVFSWATGMGSVQATLLVGQILNGLAVLTLYPLTLRIADQNRWAGVGAVLVASLLSPIPAYYVNWGRYAQLAGQAILPVALWLLWELVRKDELGKIILLSGVVISGMSLAYYRMVFYYVPFVLAWLIGWGLPQWKGNLRQWLRIGARLALVAGISLVLFLPWGRQVAGGRLATALEAGVISSSPAEQVWADYQVWRNITFFVPVLLLLLSFAALVWSLLQQRWAVAAIGLWVLGLSLLVAGRLIRLPGANMMQNFAILIALYIPAALLVGWLVGRISQGIMGWVSKAGPGAVGAMLAIAAFWGALGQLRIVNPSFVMVTRPDFRAMAWIRQHTPPDGRFLVEGFRIYGGRSAVGADAGWWIPLLAGRENTMPPQYALLNEEPSDAGYTQRVVNLVAHLETHSPVSPEGIKALCDWGITQFTSARGRDESGRAQCSCSLQTHWLIVPPSAQFTVRTGWRSLRWIPRPAGQAPDE